MLWLSDSYNKTIPDGYLLANPFYHFTISGVRSGNQYFRYFNFLDLGEAYHEP